MSLVSNLRILVLEHLHAVFTSPKSIIISNSVHKFSKLHFRAAKEFGAAFLSSNVSMEPSEVSMLWFFWYVKSCGKSQRIWEVDNGAQVDQYIVIEV